ncbi:MAG: FAD-binding oxidoreductase [Dehalococcoidia bacterium]|nr:FAD-binding oxidoreductase [Dehalococcoidia bacterium]
MNVEKLRSIVGEDWIITKREQMENYLTDATILAARPEVADEVIVVKPADSKEISEILKLANIENTPVFIRGGGTGLCGGAIPTMDGIVLSTERLDRIEEIDKDNLMVVAQAGVTLGTMLEAVEDAGLFFPPHPGDEGAQVGGLVACNAGGTRAVKYGVIRNFVKGLEVVLPSGEIVNLGGKLLKNNQGLDLLHLMINSGGILGVITKVIFRLYPKVASSGTLVIAYDNRHDAIDGVPVILRSGVIPLAIEYTDRDVIEASAKHLGMKWPSTVGNAYLIVMLIGASEDEVYTQAEQISDICQKSNALDILIAESKTEQADILKMRSEIFSGVLSVAADGLDVTVPPASVGILMDKIDEIAKQFDTTILMCGHAGDGNLHPLLLKELCDKGIFKQVKRAIYQAAIELDGVITGEHGLGLIRIPDIDLYPGGKTWNLMRGIKKVFDPNNILNPGRAIP